MSLQRSKTWSTLPGWINVQRDSYPLRVTTPVEISPYDANWPIRFEDLRGQVAAALVELNVGIEHVGSTAVPGLSAKPVIDIDVVVPSDASVADVVDRLVASGYRHEGDLGIPGREALEAPPGRWDHHLYVVTAGNAAHRNHVMFRDYLRAHPEEAAKYGDLKVALASVFVTDRDGYTTAKTDFITEIIRAAGER